jgi:hypothetical protein
MSDQTQAVIFVHKGKVPRYLFVALEQARLSNPDAIILLLTDAPQRLTCSLRVEQFFFGQLETPLHTEFLRRYYHISTNPEGFEKFCFSRWFYIQAAMKIKGLARALCVDSDCMIFASMDELFQKFYLGGPLTICQTGSPHCALVNGDLTPVLENFVETFDPSRKQEHQERFETLRSERWVLSDMCVLCDLVSKGGATGYWYSTRSDAVITAIMNAAEGFVVWPGKHPLKRVLWRQEEGWLVPYLKPEKGEWVRALALHYKGGSKRKMRRFNKPAPILPQEIRCWAFNCINPSWRVQLW